MRSLMRSVYLFVISLLIFAAAGAAGAAPPSKALDAYVNAYTSMGKAAALMFANNNNQANAQAKWVTTMADAQAKLINAQAAWITAKANAKATDAQTLQTLEQVRGLKLENSVKVANTFYEKRKLYDGYQGLSTHERATAEDLLRYSKTPVPQRPANYQIDPLKGEIFWPEVFQEEEFYVLRTQVDCLFAQRKAAPGTRGGEVFGQVQNVAAQMREELRSRVRQMDPTEYLAARKFIDSLAFEARFPARIEGMAAN